MIDAGEPSFSVAEMAQGDDPAYGIVKTLTVQYTVDGKPHKASGQDPDTIYLIADAVRRAQRRPRSPASTASAWSCEAWQNGRFEFTRASGAKLAYKVEDLPPVQTVAGPWQLKFPAGSASPRASHL